MNDIDKWTEIFNSFLNDEKVEVCCSNCNNQKLKFSKITLKNRLLISAFCERCSFIKEVIKVQD